MPTADLFQEGRKTEALNDYAQCIAHAVGAAKIGVCVTVYVGGEPRNVLVSDEAVEILGHPREVLLSRSVFEFIAPEERTRLRDSNRRRLEGDFHLVPADTTIVRADGRRTPITYVVTELMLGGDHAHVSLLWDVSAQRGAELAFREQEERFRRLFESAPDGVVVSRNGIVLEANPAAARMLGHKTAADMVGTSLHAIMTPTDAKTMMERVAAAQGGARLTPREYVARRMDGTVVTAEITSVPYNHDDGAPAVLAFARDVTDRARLQTQLAQSERLAALGTLAAGVAHEINNPLTVVALGIQAVELRLQHALETVEAEERREVTKLFNEIRGSVDRVASIVGELRAFSRTDDDAPLPTDVIQTLDAAERMAAHRLRHCARVNVNYDAVPLVKGHPRRLEQVFVNLLINAAQAMPDGREGNRIDIRAYLADEQRVAIEVTDNGGGIAPETLKNVFDPFFTTKKVGEGTGLGLAICHRIITRLGGEIILESEVGRGTTARVLLSRAEIPEPVKVTPTEAARVQPKRSRILIVDDEPALAFTLRMLLVNEHGGEHDVTIVDGGDAACRLLLEGPAFDVVLCDVMMPGVTGIDVHARVAAARPDLLSRIVFMTGGAFTQRAADFLASIPNRVLQKPFAVDELRKVVAEMKREGAAAR